MSDEQEAAMANHFDAGTPGSQHADVHAAISLCAEAANALEMAFEMLGDERTLMVYVDPWGLLRDLRTMSNP